MRSSSTRTHATRPPTSATPARLILEWLPNVTSLHADPLDPLDP
jgi:hypothetical protein